MKNTLFIMLQHLVPQHLISRVIGRLADCEKSCVKNRFIRWFAKRYKIDMSLAAQESLEAYPSFNAFFTRALKEGVRPIDQAEHSIACPADGAISQLGPIDYERIFQAKGRQYSLTALLGGSHKMSAPFKNGSFATIYLSPRDYHRVHIPVTGTLVETRYIPGDLYSVNQVTAAGVDNLFARNERMVCIFDTEYGPMAMVLVGAMIVAGVETVWGGRVPCNPREPIHTDYRGQGLTFEKGTEIGRFILGSTVVLLFGPEVAQWNDSLQATTPVQLGQAMGQAQPLAKETAS